MGGRVRAVLFDLDGTLLDIDTEVFLSDYFRRLGRALAGFFVPDDFIPRLIRATEAMIADRDLSRPNRDVFMAHFFDGLDVDREAVLSAFDRFYRSDFPGLSVHARPMPGNRDVVERVLGAGLLAVVATAPLFPRVAIEERLRWAGLDDLTFSLVTTYEDMHACKPHPEYYREILERLGVEPESCLMVGNDVEEDLAAAELGIRTFLVEGRVIHRGRRPCTPDHRGPLTDVPRVLGLV